MGFHKLLERLGFVRLRDYGLLLTVDGRIVTTRKILDDGFGATVVGYTGGDLAALELTPESKPAPPLPFAPTLAAPVVAPPPPPALVPPPAPSAAPILAKSREVPAASPPIAEPPEPEEDEWEWEIAMARVRAEAANAALQEVTQTQFQVTNPWHEETTSTRVQPVPAPRREETTRLTAVVGSPRTIIPVPTLPVANDAQTVVRQIAPLPRLARGTGTLRG